MAIDFNQINEYKYLTQSFCEPDFADYYRRTGLTRKDWIDNKRSALFMDNLVSTPKEIAEKGLSIH